ncbi:MAG: alpha/beta hydrolase [Candidatus Dojkabacteria bacterium]
MNKIFKSSFDYSKHTTTYKGFNIQTYSFGTGEKVVFSFPSFPHSELYYLWFLTHYDPSKVRFITFDLPGWAGYSEDMFRNRDFNIDEYVDIAKQILKDYKVEEFSVIGYSFGGAMALKLAADLKNQVKKVVLVSSVINSNLIGRFHTFKLINIVHYLKYYSVLKTMIIRKMREVSKVLIIEESVPEVFLEMYSDMVAHLDPRVIAESIYQLFTSDYTKYLEDIKDKEILIVNSSQEDKIFRVQAEYLRKSLQNEKSLHIHGSHDDFILRCKADVVKDVINFLTK